MKNAHIEAFDVCCIESSSLVCRRIWHLSFCQVAGFHRAVPSTTLDKAVCNFFIYYKDFFKIVNCFFLVFRIKCSQFLYGHFMTLLVEYDKYWI